MSYGPENDSAIPLREIAPVTPVTHAMLSALLVEARAAMAHDIDAAARVIDKASALLRPVKPPRRGLDCDQVGGTPRGGLAPWQMKLVRQHVDANLSSNITVDQMAGIARLSASYFGRAFKASFGAAPHAYVLRRRVERASHLIRTTKEPLAWIALECGLSDQSHLSRVFKLHVGESPAAWRRLHCGRCDESIPRVS
jgi:AraC family transcriptional regulator